MIVAFLLMSAILMMFIQTSMATEKDIMSNDVIKHIEQVFQVHMERQDIQNHL